MTPPRPVDYVYAGRAAAIDSQTCIRCGKQAVLFSTGAAWNEYLISALCQPCQDELFAELDPEER